MKIRIQQIADTSRKKRGLPLLALGTVFISDGSLLIGCARFRQRCCKKTDFERFFAGACLHRTAAPVSSEPEEEADLIEEEGESPSESVPNDTDTLLELEKVLERITSDMYIPISGGTMAMARSQSPNF
jgi:hypothetical protein